MSTDLKTIAARYASALRVAGSLASASDPASRPSLNDIWLWHLEDRGAAVVLNWKHKKEPEGAGYDHFYVYHHRHCLKSRENIQNAPDVVLFEAMGLSASPLWGWYQYMVRDLGWHSMIAANWGHSVLKIPDGVTYDTTTVEQRRAQAVAFFLDLMRERGQDVLGYLREVIGKIRSRAASRFRREPTEDELLAWLGRRNWAARDVYLYGGKPNPPDVLTRPGEPAYKGEHRVEFAAKIRETAARRRANAQAAWSCDCAERAAAEAAEDAAAEDAAGWEREREGVAHALRGEELLRRAVDIGVCPDDELLPRLRRHLEEWTSAEYHIRNAYLQDRLAVFLARNEKARDLLRLFDHRELAYRVKKEVRWLHIPIFAGRGRRCLPLGEDSRININCKRQDLTL